MPTSGRAGATCWVPGILYAASFSLTVTQQPGCAFPVGVTECHEHTGLEGACRARVLHVCLRNVALSSPPDLGSFCPGGQGRCIPRRSGLGEGVGPPVAAPSSGVLTPEAILPLCRPLPGRPGEGVMATAEVWGQDLWLRGAARGPASGPAVVLPGV